jgi:cellulose synthase/poly-beta-1,6-N-acetylglucosamine synthase-like glycosyltransferase
VTWYASLIIVLYAIPSIYILAYSISQAHLLIHYFKRIKHPKKTPQADNYRPQVLIQLPIYNEQFVVKRLIDAVCSINYPKHLMHIQILDDSDDATTEIISQAIKEPIQNGFQITHVRRSDRSEYKAGALKHGLELNDAPFVAIFDADFIPDSNFLLHTLPYFKNDKIGLVQSRWGHLNKDDSLLTRLQAFGLDAHFVIEQNGRCASKCYINFNGTAGIWRRACIIDAGNWSDASLTEDLELSYRAQLKGWQFVYTDAIQSPAELPPVMSALKSQQYRWTKGGAETARIHLGALLFSKSTFVQKIQGSFHLLNTLIFPCILLSSLLSIPLLQLRLSSPELIHFFRAAQSMLISFVLIGAVYYYSLSKDIENRNKRIVQFVVNYPLFLAFSMALSFSNTIALIEGYLGKKSPFIRTPKYNDALYQAKSRSVYKLQINPIILLVECVLMLYFSFGIYMGITRGERALIAYHVLLALGYGMIVYYSLRGSSSR